MNDCFLYLYLTVSIVFYCILLPFSGFSLAGPSSTPRKRQVRFSARHDIILLREVIAQNPFASKEPGQSSFFFFFFFFFLKEI